MENQNSEHALMPVTEAEALAYEYVGEDRHTVSAFLSGQRSLETIHDGVAVTELLMAS